jgi:hypothetical protein
LSFVNNSAVTMTGPSGATTNFEFSADKLAGYMDSSSAALPLYYYIGAKPQQNSNLGLSAVVSKVKIQGVATPIDEDFVKNYPLDTTTWELAANNAAGVQSVPANGVSWVRWTLPDAGFALQTNSVVTATGWNENGLPTLQLASSKKVLLHTSDLPGAKAGYYRMIKRAFTKLQVLMPGETNAPGTATGKIGTPTPQVVGVPFGVTVNAVDDTWHQIVLAANDEIAITSDDPNFPAVNNASLVAGTTTFSVTFGTDGTYSITATDVTDATKTANTGTPTTVTP